MIHTKVWSEIDKLHQQNEMGDGNFIKMHEYLVEKPKKLY
jgi:hypothetical protein